MTIYLFLLTVVAATGVVAAPVPTEEVLTCELDLVVTRLLI
jgi:hypothetical protein